jgi:hypothetical protein
MHTSKLSEKDVQVQKRYREIKALATRALKNSDVKQGDCANIQIYKSL